ncbi:MAG: alpha/beta hydrolase [Clostridia bacterium]|nr:alpha/beta hydrolase [Clostridia bacterium]
MAGFSQGTENGGLFNEDGLVLSDNYSRVMDTQVIPFLHRHRTDFSVNRGGVSLFASRFVPEGTPRGTVMIVHGFTENIEKYAEIIHSLLRTGWCVLAYDQRGHGRSGRKSGIQDLSLTHVDRFEDYVEDMKAVIADALAPMPGPKMLLCHSMGGAVSAMFLENERCPFERAVFMSPMIAPNLGGAPASLVKAVCLVPIALGLGQRRAFISRPYTGPEDFDTSCATGLERFSWYETLRGTAAEFTNNGPSYRWALEAINVTKKLLAPGLLEKITIPVRVFGAENESSVIPSAQETFVSHLKNGSLERIPGSKHEIYRSPDSVLFPWWRRVLSFLAGETA